MVKKLVLLILLFFPCLAAAEDGIRYCDELFVESGEWKHPNRQTLTNVFTSEAEKLAVKNLFKEGLEKLEYTVINQENMVNALRNLIKYDDTKIVTQEPLSFCLILNNCRIDEQDKSRFEPVFIGSVCNTNPDFIQSQIEQIKKSVVSSLKQAGQQQLASLLPMMNDTSKITSMPDNVLTQFFHVKEIQTDASAVEGTRCMGVYVYPVEFYAASTIIKK